MTFYPKLSRKLTVEDLNLFFKSIFFLISIMSIGAGTIFCNYDGYSKNEITISSDTFVGSNVSLVAPLKIGNNVVIGAGSTITNDIQNNELSIGRTRQINKKRKK